MEMSMRFNISKIKPEKYSEKYREVCCVRSHSPSYGKKMNSMSLKGMKENAVNVLNKIKAKIYFFLYLAFSGL